MDFANCKIMQGRALDVLRALPSASVHCCVTSPPYWGLRDYGVDGQQGLEATPELYLAGMVAVFEEVLRVLRSDGTCWVNMGDGYAGSGKGRNADGRHSTDEKWEQSTNEGSINGELYTTKAVEGLKQKDLIGMPWRLAFALQAAGWWLRQDIIWHKPNPMPESVTDRCTKAHEYVFLLTKSARYYYDAAAVMEASVTDEPRRPYGSEGAWQMDGRPAEQRHGGEPRSWHGSSFHDGKNAAVHPNVGKNRKRGEFNGKTNALPGRELFRKFTEVRNKRSVWTIPSQPYAEAHFATFPEALVEPCVLAGCPHGGVVLDPYCGSGTTGLVSVRHGRRFVGIELNPAYIKLAQRRITEGVGLLLEKRPFDDRRDACATKERATA